MEKAKERNAKQERKMNVYYDIAKHLEDEGAQCFNGQDFGFTGTTLVARFDDVDIQIKVVAPKLKMTRYTMVEKDDTDTTEKK